MKIIARMLINAVALAVVVYLFPSITISNGIVGLILVAVIFGVVNAFIRPIVQLFSLPITCLTLGLFTLVIKALLRWGSDDVKQRYLPKLASSWVGAYALSRRDPGPTPSRWRRVRCRTASGSA